MQRDKEAKAQSNILKTLVYSDIFDYPLTAREVWKFLISNTDLAVEVVQKHLKILTDPSASSGQVYTDGEFYFLKGREKIVKDRKEREGWSQGKLEIAQRVADKLKAIPLIKMIGITGALAVRNAKENDDIDLLVVTSRDSLWPTRLLILILSPFMGINRRKPKDVDVKDKICFNLFLEEDHLKIQSEGLFLAHEIVQVRPIYDRGGVYDKFIKENEWVRRFLSNAMGISNIKYQISKTHIKNKKSRAPLIGRINHLFFKMQYLYMKPKMACEKVNFHQAFFHPNNLQSEIEREYKKRIDSLGLDKKKN